ncbi:MAG: fibronectin type III domain-containing protein [Opitutaceae bacterium]
MFYFYLSPHRAQLRSRSWLTFIAVLAAGLGRCRSGLRPEGTLSRPRWSSLNTWVGFVGALALSVVELSAAVPSAPTTVVAVGGDREALVSFAPPPNSSPDIKNYTVTASPGGRTERGKSSPLTVTKLTNGTAYTFTVAATNADGTSAASAPSAPVVPSANTVVEPNVGTTAPVIPGSPTAVVAVRGDREVVVSFAAPLDSDSKIKNYTVTASPGGRTERGKSSPLTVTSLTNGTAYTFTVTATNDAGTSAASAPSAPITPSADSLVGINLGISGSVVRINSTVIDSAGNIYLAGNFDGSALLYNGVTLNKIGAQDLWVAKLNPDRTLVWIKNFGGSNGAKVTPNGLVVDGAGAIHVGGYFSGSGLSTPVLAKVSTAANKPDAFVLKLDNNGTTLWAKNFGGESAATTGSCLAVDVNANVYLGGYFESGDLTVPAISKITRSADWDGFVIKLSSAGETRWAKKYGGAAAATKVQSIAVDASENVYFAGQSNLGKMTRPALKRLSHDGGGHDVFLIKLDHSGQTIWSKNFGGKGANTFNYAMTMDKAGFVYICGAFMNGSMTSPVLKHTRSGHAFKDAYVLKVDPQGEVIWAQNYGGPEGQAEVNSITVDRFSQVYLGGIFKHADLARPKLGKIGNQDMFALKLDATGAVTWAKNFGGTGTDTTLNSIACDAQGNVYLGGAFRSGKVIAPAFTKVGIADAFLITAYIADPAASN